MCYKIVYIYYCPHTRIEYYLRFIIIIFIIFACKYLDYVIMSGTGQGSMPISGMLNPIVNEGGGGSGGGNPQGNNPSSLHLPPNQGDSNEENSNDNTSNENSSHNESSVSTSENLGLNWRTDASHYEAKKKIAYNKLKQLAHHDSPNVGKHMSSKHLKNLAFSQDDRDFIKQVIESKGKSYDYQFGKNNALIGGIPKMLLKLFESK